MNVACDYATPMQMLTTKEKTNKQANKQTRTQGC